MSERTRDFKHILLDHIKSHRERLVTLTRSCLASIDKKKGTKRGRSNSSLIILVKGLEAAATQFPQKLKGDPRDLNLGLSTAMQLQSFDHSLKAASAWRQENIEESLKHLLQAAYSLGQAKAFSQMQQVQSVIAQGKSEMSHARTKRMRAQVVKHWREKIDPKVSAEYAAGEMVGIFRWEDGTDVTHRTLAKWIAAARRNEPRSK